MAVERTLTYLRPEPVAGNVIGERYARAVIAVCFKDNGIGPRTR